MAEASAAAANAGPTRDRIAFVGHATTLIEMQGARLLTDPLLRRRVAHLRRQVPLPHPGDVAGPDAVLISHLHHDHLDLASLRLLGQKTRLIVPAGAGDWLARHGFAEVTELEVGELARVGALTVAAVAAHHDGRRHPGGPRAQTLGFVITGRRAVYFAGDTELFEGMSELAPRLDLALVPVAGWGPKLGPGHMDPLDAARAVALLRPRLAVPVHWGTLLPVALARHNRALLSDPPQRFAEHVARLAPDVEVRILLPGQQTML